MLSENVFFPQAFEMKDRRTVRRLSPPPSIPTANLCAKPMPPLPLLAPSPILPVRSRFPPRGEKQGTQFVSADNITLKTSCVALFFSQDPFFAITIIAAEEQLRGWLAKIHGAKDAEKQVAWYDQLAWLILRSLPWHVSTTPYSY